MFNNIGTTEIIIIAILVMVLFGSDKLPEFTRSIGEASKEFRRSYKENSSSGKSKKRSATKSVAKDNA